VVRQKRNGVTSLVAKEAFRKESEVLASVVEDCVTHKKSNGSPSEVAHDVSG